LTHFRTLQHHTAYMYDNTLSMSHTKIHAISPLIPSHTHKKI
jgi:hypothetical protein